MVFNFAYEQLTKTMFSLTKCLRAHMSKFERIFFTYAQDLRELTDTYEMAAGSNTLISKKKYRKLHPTKRTYEPLTDTYAAAVLLPLGPKMLRTLRRIM